MDPSTFEFTSDLLFSALHSYAKASWSPTTEIILVKYAELFERGERLLAGLNDPVQRLQRGKPPEIPRNRGILGSHFGILYTM